MFKLNSEKTEEQEVKLLASIGSTEKSREVQKNIYFCLIDYAKDFLWITTKFGKLSSGHRTGKGQFSFQSQRKAMPRNAQTTVQLHSSHTLVK